MTDVEHEHESGQNAERQSRAVERERMRYDFLSIFLVDHAYLKYTTSKFVFVHRCALRSALIGIDKQSGRLLNCDLMNTTPVHCRVPRQHVKRSLYMIAWLPGIVAQLNLYSLQGDRRERQHSAIISTSHRGRVSHE